MFLLHYKEFKKYQKSGKTANRSFVYDTLEEGLYNFKEAIKNNKTKNTEKTYITLEYLEGYVND